jgi:cytohesin
MNAAGFLFRTFLLAIFTLSLLAGAIVTDYYLRHEITRKAKRFLAANGVELSTPSAIKAASNGEVILLEKLEHAGVSLGHSDAYGHTPLLAAIQSKNLQAVDFLIRRRPVLDTINILTNPDRQTPLAVALNDRDFELVDRLLDKGAELNVEREPGLPFLIGAIAEGDEEMISFLIDRKVDLEKMGAQPAGALATAADLGKIDLMARLLDAGASPNVRGVSGKSLLIESVKERNREKFDLLLARGADVNATVGDGAGGREANRFSTR